MKKHTLTHLFFALITLSLIACSNVAFAINKCTLDDKITYTDAPCPDSADSEQFNQPVIPPDNPAAQKKRHQANQKKLQKIEQQKAKDEQRHQRETKALAQQIKKQEEHQFKCKELDLKRRAARQHQSEVQLKRNSYATEKARLKVKQAENRYTHYCKS